MMKKRQLCLALTALIIAGCSDDSGAAGASGGGVGSGCSDAKPCVSGVCVSGQCIEEKKQGESCEDTSECAGDLVCYSRICSIGVELGGDCSAAGTVCVQDLSCRDGRCVTIVKDGEDCSGSNAACQKGSYCHSGVCTPDANYFPCTSDEDCTSAGDGFVCLSDGACGRRVGLGETCKAEHVECMDGLLCEYNYCTQENGENEHCDALDSEKDMLYFCKRGLECVDEICRMPVVGIERGGECNDAWMICAGNLKCTNGRCTDFVAETNYCKSEEYIECLSENNQCIKNVCTPVGNSCKSNEECHETDSYCCLDDACGAKGFCIPFDDEKDHDTQCLFKTKPGVFEARIQCRWPPKDIPLTVQPNSKSVEIPALVGHFGNKQNIKTAVAFYSYSPTVIRIINPETCETLESIVTSLNPRWNNYPVAADLDGDGLMEFVFVASDSIPIAFKWNKEKQIHEQYWKGGKSGGYFLKAFDVNGDGKLEIVSNSVVLNGQTGAVIASQAIGDDTTLGMLRIDGKDYTVLSGSNGVFKYDDTQTADKKWVRIATFPDSSTYHAYADFGTPGATAAEFNYGKLDGIQEFAAVKNGKLHLYTLVKNDTKPGTFNVQEIMTVTLLSPVSGYGSGSTYGGPLTIGDFDNDGLPEIGVASSGYYGVYDPLCKGYKAGECADKYVRWERWSQDSSSGRTGSTLFDFDGDGQAEAVYGDECFTRVYDGITGKILFSSKRGSNTAEEAPVVADVDNDGSAEIIMGAPRAYSCYDDSGTQTKTGEDPIHEGIRCQDDEDCPMAKGCNKSVNLCTCTSDNDCNTQYLKNADGTESIMQQYVCTSPIHPQVGFMINADGTGRKLAKKMGTRPDGWKAGDYKVCRATRKSTAFGEYDLMIYRDRLDRWVSSRDVWNQHGYNIINIEDNGEPTTSARWFANFLLKKAAAFIKDTTDLRPVNNNYRLNQQGMYGAGTVPDITGRFTVGSICGKTDDGRSVISGKLCNRGTKPVATNLPATFYYYSDTASDHKGDIICTSYTNTPVGVGQCDQVGCEVSEETLKALAGKKVIMSTNVDEHGLPSTVECRYDNNDDIIEIEECNKDIVIAN